MAVPCESGHQHGCIQPQKFRDVFQKLWKKRFQVGSSVKFDRDVSSKFIFGKNKWINKYDVKILILTKISFWETISTHTTIRHVHKTPAKVISSLHFCYLMDKRLDFSRNSKGLYMVRQIYLPHFKLSPVWSTWS